MHHLKEFVVRSLIIVKAFGHLEWFSIKDHRAVSIQDHQRFHDGEHNPTTTRYKSHNPGNDRNGITDGNRNETKCKRVAYYP